MGRLGVVRLSLFIGHGSVDRGVGVLVVRFTYA